MRYLTAVLLQVLLFVSISLSAAAQQSEDLAKKETPRFSGLYFGLGGGYGDYSSGGSGEYVDLFAGIRKQTDSGLVYGVEGTWGVINTTDEDLFLDLDGYASVFAKLGYTSNNKVMYYGGLGYASINVNDRLSGIDGSSDGVALEAGLEYMASSFFGLRLRGQYHLAGGDADIATIGAALILSF